jgi:hypothetical protein
MGARAGRGGWTRIGCRPSRAKRVVSCLLLQCHTPPGGWLMRPKAANRSACSVEVHYCEVKTSILTVCKGAASECGAD